MRSIWRSLSLGTKITAVIIITTLVMMATVLPAIFFSLKEGMLRQQQSHLQAVKNLVEGLISDNQKAIRNYAVLFSSDKEITDNLFYHTELAGERSHPLNALMDHVKAFDVRFIELTDSRGRTVANTLYPDQYDIDRSSDPMISSALSGYVSVGLERHGQGFIVMAVAPVYFQQDQLIGSITTGAMMDESFASTLKSLTGVEIAIVDNDKNIVASTLPLLAGAADVASDREVALSGGERYLPVRIPLSGYSGERLGYVIMLAENTLPFVLRNTNLAVSVILVLVAAVSVVFTVLIIRRVISPLKSLADGALRIGTGDFHHRVPVPSDDEIGSLAESFNQMAETLGNLRIIEDKLEQSQKLALLGRFTAGVAHEINNPVANMIGLLKLMKKEAGENHPMREEIDLVIKEADRCSSIVRDLLLYSRQPQPEKEMVKLNPLVESMIGLLGQYFYADGKVITVEKNLQTGLPDIPADPVQMEQVLRNILVNAVQSIASQGTISVSTAAYNGVVEISVRDTGCGIRKENIEKIFYPFFTTKKPSEGTGLGLSMSYGIVQGHGGEIRVESREGAGSTFSIVLPAGN